MKNILFVDLLDEFVIMRNLHLNCHHKTQLNDGFELDPGRFHFHVASDGSLTVYSSGKVLRLSNGSVTDVVSIAETLQADGIDDDEVAGLEVTTEGTVVLITKKGNVKLLIL